MPALLSRTCISPARQTLSQKECQDLHECRCISCSLPRPESSHITCIVFIDCRRDVQCQEILTLLMQQMAIRCFIPRLINEIAQNEWSNHELDVLSRPARLISAANTITCKPFASLLLSSSMATAMLLAENRWCRNCRSSCTGLIATRSPLADVAMVRSCKLLNILLMMAEDNNGVRARFIKSASAMETALSSDLVTTHY